MKKKTIIGHLSREQVLNDKQTDEPITSLILTHRALSDVSCLSEFKNLEKLDLAFNSLTSLEDLRECVNLKWLSVVQNKLTSLKGIEALRNLTVINAGKNKLKSIDEVKSVTSLRALIFNDNEIRSICRLDHLKELNTLVLSRNPIRDIGEALANVKSISKIQTIDSSFKFCSELKELRLAHNEIQALPAELAENKKLINLDLGNNAISRCSDLKVLGSLTILRNLNLLGNPIAENEKLAKKVQKWLPNLHVFNSKPTKNNIKNERNDNKVDDFSLDGEIEKEPKNEVSKEEQRKSDIIEKPKKRKLKDGQSESDVIEKSKKKVSMKERTELDIIDDGETSFTEIFSTASRNNDGKKKSVEKIAQQLKSVDASATVINHKKNESRVIDPEPVSTVVEIGLGGPSTWDN
ncbi:hypothetical protein ACFE04_028646 [Oxalis oulophora]